MLIDKTEIRRLIPHAGRMCLLDSVTAWDATSIRCTTATHRDSANPLRRDDRLAALHAIEYGAQAVAIHGGLLARAAGQPAPLAYLAAVRDARLYAERLDAIEEPLAVTARWLAGKAGNCVYHTCVKASARAIAEARITIISRSALKA